MTIFEQAKAHADEAAPSPHETPRMAAATAAGFGLAVIALFVALQWVGVPAWIAWTASALAYGGIAYADCRMGWQRNAREYRDALDGLKARPGPSSVH